MPCNTITTTKLDLSKASAEVLASALASLGLTVREKTATRVYAVGRNNTTVEWQQGKGTIVRTQDTTLAAKIPQSYAAATIALAAKRNGWLVKQTEQNKFQVIRR